MCANVIVQGTGCWQHLHALPELILPKGKLTSEQQHNQALHHSLSIR